MNKNSRAPILITLQHPNKRVLVDVFQILINYKNYEICQQDAFVYFYLNEYHNTHSQFLLKSLFFLRSTFIQSVL